MAESNQAAELEAQLTAMMKKHERDVIGVTEKALRELRERLPAEFTPGLLAAEEYCRGMVEMQHEVA